MALEEIERRYEKFMNTLLKYFRFQVIKNKEDWVNYYYSPIRSSENIFSDNMKEIRRISMGFQKDSHVFTP